MKYIVWITLIRFVLKTESIPKLFKSDPYSHERKNEKIFHYNSIFTVINVFNVIITITIIPTYRSNLIFDFIVSLAH